MIDDLDINLDEYERKPYGGGGESHLPAGLYSGTITRVVPKTNSQNAKDPTGKYLEVEFDIIEPSEYSRRKMWDKFIYKNSNIDAVRIGKEALADLAKALGFTGNFSDTSALIGRSCCFYLEVTPAKGQYPAGNRVRKYLPSGSSEEHYAQWLLDDKGGNTAKPAAPAERPKWGGSAAPQAQQAGATPSWKK